MSEQELDKLAPKLDELSLATALNACRDAGAWNTAEALSKHVTRMQIDFDILRRSHAEAVEAAVREIEERHLAAASAMEGEGGVEFAVFEAEATAFYQAAAIIKRHLGPAAVAGEKGDG